MQFQQTINPDTGAVDPDSIQYTDDSGASWWVPKGHRFWVLYEDWLLTGNTPQTAA